MAAVDVGIGTSEFGGVVRIRLTLAARGELEYTNDAQLCRMDRDLNLSLRPYGMGTGGCRILRNGAR